MVNKKIKYIQDKIQKNEVLLVINKSNLFYLTDKNFDGYSLVIFKNFIKVLTSEMFYFQLRDVFEKKDIIVENDFFKQILRLDFKNKIIFIDDINSLSVSVYEFLKKNFTIKFNNIIFDMRKLKTEEEIYRIRRAVNIIKNIIADIKKIIKVGIKEIEVKNFILKRFIENNVEAAFDPIVAFDENTSYPHHISSTKKFKKQSIVLIDLGCKYKGYCCDVTRMYNIEKNNRVKDLYFKLKNLQKDLISMCKEGVKVKDIDTYARNYFKKLGLERNYLHSTGHGIGVDIHELPRIYFNNEDILKKNIVITIEPGIYFYNKFGLRIEDDIICRGDYSQVITEDV